MNRHCAVRALLTSMSLFATSRALAQSSTSVTTESVVDYSAVVGNHTADIPNANVDSQGFIDAVTAHIQTPGVPSSEWPIPFSVLHQYADSAVDDTDFVDPNVTGSGRDDDTDNFDQLGTAIAWFDGHGTMGGETEEHCQVDADCLDAPGHCSTYPTCAGSPVVLVNDVLQCSQPTVHRRCTYAADLNLVTANAFEDYHGHFVDYTSGIVKWGESAQSGAWGGAAENGGVNLAVMSKSFGVDAGWWLQELAPVFAGVHLVATTMPVSGDANIPPNRGEAFGVRYLVNPHGAVSDAWNSVVGSLGHEGGPCAGSTASDYSVGGGGGYNGCGCNLTLSVDSTETNVRVHLGDEDWYLLQNDTLDATAAVWYNVAATCNYDVAGYPFNNP